MKLTKVAGFDLTMWGDQCYPYEATGRMDGRDVHFTYDYGKAELELVGTGVKIKEEYSSTNVRAVDLVEKNQRHLDFEEFVGLLETMIPALRLKSGELYDEKAEHIRAFLRYVEEAHGAELATASMDYGDRAYHPAGFELQQRWLTAWLHKRRQEDTGQYED